uniref:Small ribosomal subunit protein bS6 n=1 Tax=candidate division WOR-3 bacterium TaxID=2052148 RepID=A0A7C4U6F3_UNCW3
MRRYEGLIIIDPRLEEEKIKKRIDEIKNMIEEKGKIEKFEEWGKKKLAYPINKSDDGYYVLFEFQGEGSLVEELKKHLIIGTDYMRFMFIRR